MMDAHMWLIYQLKQKNVYFFYYFKLLRCESHMGH